MAETGAEAHSLHHVTEADTAVALDSGDLAVLGTPRLLAWCEQQTVAAVAADLPVGSTSVGTRVSIEHVRASPVGTSVDVRARLVHADGRLLRFEVAATDEQGRLVGHGEITRVVVNADRFLSRLD